MTVRQGCKQEKKVSRQRRAAQKMAWYETGGQEARNYRSAYGHKKRAGVRNLFAEAGLGRAGAAVGAELG
eukprot:CAMPEP_0198650082 /NCGR_PEP_ID=MMETSP1467-20131203/4720_1 /TAXON_ID=1462469 /ORGANISM="unid. sp., Strain CCMP2135" /LENGTH=69 /DNA_ID=CAMNT_0044385909 /DNA_START=91 /DNA_END=298 /DNA_ORIENTATION=+